jgi:flagellar biosynthesis protein FlhF
MRLKIFRAASVPEAMRLVRAELGPDALIVSTRRMTQGVEVTAATEAEEPPAPVPLHDSAAAMNFHGVPAELATMLCGCDLAAGLSSLLRFQPMLMDGDRPALFTGTPGAGKTLSVARLATRLVLSGTLPIVITTDGRRAGAAEELAAFTRVLGIRLIAASTPSALSRALQSRPGNVPVLIDTAGLNPHAPAEIAEMQALAAACGANIILVAQAGLDAAEAGEQAVVFAQAGARFLLPTRLDLARRLGSVIAAAAYGRLALGEAGTGPGATEALELLSADRLAARLTELAAAPSARKVHHARHA